MKNNHIVFGVVSPNGVEAFLFSFQNGGLFFEAAPFFTLADNQQHNLGIRTVAGLVFYFQLKEKEQIIN
jgi:hypothetical protein